MTRRSMPEFKPGGVVRAPHLQKIADEVGRSTGLDTGGTAEYVDNKCGRFPIPPKKTPQIEICHGVILEVCNQGCSTYRVQRVHRFLKAPCDDCGSGSGSGS